MIDLNDPQYELPTLMKTENDIMPFGQYKGQRMIAILLEDASYIIWLYKNNIIAMDKKLFLVAKEILDQQYDSQMDAHY